MFRLFYFVSNLVSIDQCTQRTEKPAVAYPALLLGFDSPMSWPDGYTAPRQKGDKKGTKRDIKGTRKDQTRAKGTKRGQEWTKKEQAGTEKGQEFCVLHRRPP
jgi:hypothetical protein